MHLRLARAIKVLANSSYYTKRLILLTLDFFLIFAALWGAVSLRLESLWPSLWQDFFWLFFALPFISFPVFIAIGLYRAVIRYAGVESLWIICKASYFCFFLLLGLVLIHGMGGFPRSVPLIFFFLLFIFIGGSRLLFRALYFRLCTRNKASRRVLIFGAGASGAQMARAFGLSDEFTAVAFIDDNALIQGRKIHSLPVFSSEHVPGLLQDLNIDMILLAMPSASKKRKREILKYLEPFPVEVKSLPSLIDMVTHEVTLRDIQDIQIEDLLGRDPVSPRMDLIESCITGKNVLVTGAGGSIGSELCRQIAATRPATLVLFEQSEYALYAIEAELHAVFGTRIEIIPILGSVGDKKRMSVVLETFKVDTLYHAAAYKHVPLVEYNVIEGIRNNLFGTLCAAQAAIEFGIETFVLISTDKAVRPTNVMGASKRMAELVLQAFADMDGKTRFTMVRFGNVLGSSGSVVPLFHNQIKAGGPVTVTHPEITRYFMTIPEAVQLVLQAGAMGKGGDVFVLDMGEPVKIFDLAKKMIRLHGYTVQDQDNPSGDIAIQFSGLRPGEKLFEELLVGSNVIGTDHPMIMRAAERFIPWDHLRSVVEDLDRACNAYDIEGIRKILLQIADGYRPQCDIVDYVWKTLVKSSATIPAGQRITRISPPGMEKGVIAQFAARKTLHGPAHPLSKVGQTG